MLNFIKRQSPARIIACGFAFLILVGSILLAMPFSVKEGAQVGYLNALYTSTSAVCVTGLTVVDTRDSFTPIGQFIIALLIQFGGLGVTTIGAGIIIAIGKKVNIKGRTLIREAMNTDSGKGLIKLIYHIFAVTVIFELTGAILSFIVFIKDYPFKEAVGVSLFHSIASFNNAGFDIIGNFQNMIPYRDNVLLNLVTGGLIFFGGIGFLVICEMFIQKFRWKKFSMHTKVVISVSMCLIILGTLLLKLTENVSWLGAFFFSISARTAGFSTYSLNKFTVPGLMVLMVLMFIGASPGSTGGGIKTSTFFVLLAGIKSAATNKTEKAFHYGIPKDVYRKSSVVAFLALGLIVTATYIICILEPHLRLVDIFFEMTSAFGTVGLSTGITPTLTSASKIVSIIVMYIGRIGPFTIATLWHFSKGERVRYPEGNISVG